MAVRRTFHARLLDAIRRPYVIAVLATISLAALFVLRNGSPFVCDIVIRNAQVYDGTGAPPFRGTVAIRGDRIVGVWRHSLPFLPHGRTTIDAQGGALAPGFIDTHTHVDLSVGDGRSPIHAENFVWQGVTTIVVGNCGRSPHEPGRLAQIVTRRKSDVNVATLIGLNSVRNRVMKTSSAPASATEIAQMQALVRRGMAEGAVGVSTGYAYVPGRFASEAEVVAQLAVARSAGGVHASHVRDEGASILGAVDEVTRASATAQIPLLISHLKITGSNNCRLYATLLRRFREYQAARGPLYVDQYPYEASSSGLDLYLPDAFLRLSERDRFRMLINSPTQFKTTVREQLRKESVQDLSFASIASYVPNVAWRGLSLRQIDERFAGHAVSTFDTQADILIDMLKHGGAQMIYRNLCPDVVESVHRDLVAMVGSDSTIRYNDGESSPHPRGWGTFPRVFSVLVRGRGVLTPEEAIRRMTDLPARFFGLEHRGRIAPGYFADLVLLDLGKIADRATYDQPFLHPVGIRVVIVNGTVEVAEAAPGWRRKATEAIPTRLLGGRFLTRTPDLARGPDGLVVAPASDRTFLSSVLRFRSETRTPARKAP